MSSLSTAERPVTSLIESAVRWGLGKSEDMILNDSSPGFQLVTERVSFRGNEEETFDTVVEVPKTSGDVQSKFELSQVSKFLSLNPGLDNVHYLSDEEEHPVPDAVSDSHHVDSSTVVFARGTVGVDLTRATAATSRKNLATTGTNGEAP